MVVIIQLYILTEQRILTNGDTVQAIDRTEIIHKKIVSKFQTGILLYKNMNIISEADTFSDSYLF